MFTTTARRNRTALVAMTTVAIVAVGAMAFAYWTSDGSGEGTAETGTDSPFTISNTSTTGDPLSPGGPDQTVNFVVTNPSDGVQDLSNVTMRVAEAAGGTWTVGDGDPVTLGDDCSAADYVVDVATITYGTIPAGGTLTGTVAFRMIDTGANQDGCKDEIVPLYFVAS